MEPRPIIKLMLSPLDKGLDLLSKFLLAGILVLTIYALVTLPAIIPIHFNAAGKADDYGKKATLLILALLAVIIYFGLTVINKYPHVFNYMTKITAGNVQQQYILATRMIRFLKLAILVIFMLVILFIYLSATGLSDGPGVWFLPFVLALTLIPSAIYIAKSVSTKNNKP